MVDHINATRDEHILTLEDPIEFAHASNGRLHVEPAPAAAAAPSGNPRLAVVRATA